MANIINKYACLRQRWLALLFLIQYKVRRLWNSISERVIKNCEAMGTVEIIIIIAVLVALALIFRNFIMELAQSIFDKIKSNTDSAIEDL